MVSVFRCQDYELDDAQNYQIPDAVFFADT